MWRPGTQEWCEEPKRDCPGGVCGGRQRKGQRQDPWKDEQGGQKIRCNKHRTSGPKRQAAMHTWLSSRVAGNPKDRREGGRPKQRNRDRRPTGGGLQGPSRHTGLQPPADPMGRDSPGARPRGHTYRETGTQPSCPAPDQRRPHVGLSAPCSCRELLTLC